MIEHREFFVKEGLNVGPDLVRFCAGKGLKHTFTPETQEEGTTYNNYKEFFFF